MITKFTTIIVSLITLALVMLPTLLHAELPSRRTAVVEVYERDSPAVVNISTEKTVRTRQNPFGNLGSIEDLFFGSARPEVKEENIPLSIGSGVIVDASGLVLTNEHILYRASVITVSLSNGKSYQATVLGSDPNLDIALLKIQAKPNETNFPALLPGNSDDLMIGETVIAIGNPFGFSNTVTTGVISALGRQVATKERVYRDFIQTDASINPGNSGGPLINIQGSLIGINTAIYAGGGGQRAEGIGFATPIGLAKRVMDDILAYGRVKPAYLGFRIWQAKGRLWVIQVDDQSPAAASGIREGDQLLSCKQQELNSEEAFRAIVLRLQRGAILSCKFRRLKEVYEASIKSSAFPADAWQLMAHRIIGTRLQEVAGKLAIARIVPGSPADRVGLRRGDRIHRINRHTIHTIQDFKDIASNLYYQSSLILVIERNQNLYYATLPLHPA